jgi:hypothetical protein
MEVQRRKHRTKPLAERRTHFGGSMRWLILSAMFAKYPKSWATWRQIKEAILELHPETIQRMGTPKLMNLWSGRIGNLLREGGLKRKTRPYPVRYPRGPKRKIQVLYHLTDLSAEKLETAKPPRAITLRKALEDGQSKEGQASQSHED